MAHFQLSPGSSANRWIDLETPLSRDLLLAEEIRGSETLGRLFEYELFAVSNRNDLNFDDLLSQHMTVLMEADGNPRDRRAIDGRVAQIGLVGMRDTLYRYRIVLRPWLWMLTRTHDCRIYQNKTTEIILKEIFADHVEADYEFRLTGHYAEREYCVQYRESDFAFVSRLMEEEGMYYFFRHEKGKHTLVICDAPSAHASSGAVRFHPLEQQARITEHSIHEWTVTREIQSGAVALRDYNFEAPSVDLLARAVQERHHAESEHELFDYPGEYHNVAEAEPLVRTRLEELQAAYEIFEGKADSRRITCGVLFALTHFARADQNREYLVVSSQVHATNNLPEMDIDASFDCRFRLIVSDLQYRSPRTTPRPIVQGPQTAVVVGPDNEEIHVDEYGRVKVQFHWDRYGKHDDESSCWVRVSQLWAGKNYGWMTIPRVGQEVVVDFLEGNPDCPLITGRVYNAEQMPPWSLPANRTQSGILTRSSAGGSAANANELCFEDKKGEELVKIHAERNMSTSVEVDDSTTVGHDQTLTVGNDQRTTIKHDQFLKVDFDRSAHVVKNESLKVDVNQTLTVGGKQHNTVLGTRTTEVKGVQTSVVGQLASDGFEATKDAKRIDVTKGIEYRGVSEDQNVKVGGNQFIDVAGELVYKAKRMHFEAEHIEHKVTGKNSVIHESKNGPYTIFANEFKLVSNTDITMTAVGNITQICNKHTVQKMGPSDSSFWAPEHSSKFAITNDFFAGLKFSTSISGSLSTALGFTSSFFAGIKMDSSLAIDLTKTPVKAYLPPAPPAPSPAATFAALTKDVAALQRLALINAVNIGVNVNASLWGGYAAISDTDAKAEKAKADAKKTLLDLADEALRAGHPNVAARLLTTALGADPGSLLAGNTDSLLEYGETPVNLLAEAIANAKGESPEKRLEELGKEREDARQEVLDWQEEDRAADVEAARAQQEQQSKAQADREREERQDQKMAEMQSQIDENRNDIDAMEPDKPADGDGGVPPDPEPGPDQPKG